MPEELKPQSPEEAAILEALAFRDQRNKRTASMFINVFVKERRSIVDVIVVAADMLEEAKMQIARMDKPYLWNDTWSAIHERLSVPIASKEKASDVAGGTEGSITPQPESGAEALPVSQDLSQIKEYLGVK